MSGHVGDRLSALVDGELDHEARDQVLAHVACCQQCKQALDAERQVRELVGSLRAEERTPVPSADMMSSLLALGARAGGEGHVPDGGALDAGGQFGALPAPGRRPGRRPDRPRQGFPSALTPGAAGTSTRPVRRPSQRPSRHRFGAVAPGTFAYAVAQPGPGRRFALGVAGAASAFGMTAALAFTLNGAQNTSPQLEVTPPTQQMGVEDAKIIPDYPSPTSGVLNDLVEPPRATGGGSVPGVPAGIQPYGR